MILVYSQVSDRAPPSPKTRSRGSKAWIYREIRLSIELHRLRYLRQEK